MRKNKNCIYTVITDDYCDLIELRTKSDGWDYYCFTDNENLKSKTWKIININYSNVDKVEKIKLSKKYKTQGFKEIGDYDNYLYIDGRIKVIKNLNSYLKCLGDYDILFNKHRSGNILKHFATIEKHGYEKQEVINKIKKRYEDYGYNYDNGLIEGGVLLFKNNESVIKFFDDWWNEIKEFSHRDQLSGNFALFLNPELLYKIGENSIYGRVKYFSLSGKRKHKRFTYNKK